MEKIYASLISGGKDSVYATYLAIKSGINVVYGINVIPKRDDSYMFHYPNAHLAPVITEAIGLKPVILEVSGEKEREVTELRDFLRDLHVHGIIAGALASRYQKERLERICKELNIELYAPLWGRDPIEHLKDIISAGFKVIIVGVYGLGLEGLLGVEINENVIERLVYISRRYGIHAAGEGGEFETLVTDGPIFRRRIIIESYNIRKGLSWAYMIINKYKVIEK